MARQCYRWWADKYGYGDFSRIRSREWHRRFVPGNVHFFFLVIKELAAETDILIRKFLPRACRAQMGHVSTASGKSPKTPNPSHSSSKVIMTIHDILGGMYFSFSVSRISHQFSPLGLEEIKVEVKRCILQYWVWQNPLSFGLPRIETSKKVCKWFIIGFQVSPFLTVFFYDCRFQVYLIGALGHLIYGDYFMWSQERVHSLSAHGSGLYLISLSVDSRITN